MFICILGFIQFFKVLRATLLFQDFLLVSAAKTVQVDHESKLVPVGSSSLVQLNVIIQAIVICAELADEDFIEFAFR